MYEHLLRKEAKIPIRGSIFLTQIDRNKGITFYDNNGKKAYCLNRQDFIEFNIDLKQYDELFDKIVQCVESEVNLPLWMTNSDGTFNMLSEDEFKRAYFNDQEYAMTECAFE